MRRLTILFFSLFLVVSCKNDSTHKKEKPVSTTSEFPASHTFVGEKFQDRDVLSPGEMKDIFSEMKAGDTLDVRFRSKVSSVCKKKGCWMNLDLPEEQEVMVKFKGYAFFVPKDIEEREVVVNGKAFVAEVSVEEQRHFAEDAGKSPKEIAAIVEPKRTLSFLADGVVIEEE